MAFVWETVGLVALEDRLHVRLLPALALVGIQNLQTGRDTRQHPSEMDSGVSLDIRAEDFKPR